MVLILLRRYYNYIMWMGFDSWSFSIQMSHYNELVLFCCYVLKMELKTMGDAMQLLKDVTTSGGCKI
jgi:hypothetical protein